MNNVGGAFDLKYVQLFRKGLVVSHDSRDVFGLVPPFAVVAQATSFRRSCKIVSCPSASRFC